MKKQRTRSVLILILVMLMLVTFAAGCGQSAPTTTASTNQAAFPVLVKNAAGESIEIASAPQSIIVTNVWAAEILLDLVSADRIKGLSSWGDDPVISAAAEKAKAVAARVKTTEPEGIITLKPDLVIIDTFTDTDGALTKTLEEAGSKVLQLASPTDFDQIKTAIATLAAAVGEQAKGAEMIADIDATLASVADKLAGLKDEDKLKVMYYEDYYDASGSSAGMLAAYGVGSPFDAIARAAGLINVCNVENYSAVSKEKVIGEWKPDLLIVPAITYGDDFSVIDDGGATIIAAIMKDELLKSLPAVKNGQVKALTEKYRSSTAQYMVQAVVELAALAYPDLMK